MRKQPRAAGGLIGVLTDREREIIQLTVTGVSNKELSRRLGIAKGTAKVHLHNIYEKLGITKRSELMTRMYAVADIAHPVPGCGSGRSLGALFLNDRRAAKKLRSPSRSRRKSRFADITHLGNCRPCGSFTIQ